MDSKLTNDDVRRITATTFVGSVGGRPDLVSFWVLLGLAAVIASAGVVADSTATVIGAMIVAPLMRPILGTAAAVVLGDRSQLIRALTLVVAGGALVVLIGFVIGMTTPVELTPETNSQIAGRINPRLIDLLAALATGLVGAFALTRAEVSDALPGVAIAISLVPPLAVVGLMLESGQPSQSLGALLTFGTNVAAIIATGVAVMVAAGLRPAALAAGVKLGRFEARTLLPVGLALALLAVPLAVGSVQVARSQLLVSQAQPVAQRWADRFGFSLTRLEVTGGELRITALGPDSDPHSGELRTQLDKAGLEEVDVRVDFALGRTVTVPGETDRE